MVDRCKYTQLKKPEGRNPSIHMHPHFVHAIAHACARVCVPNATAVGPVAATQTAVQLVQTRDE